MIYVGLLRLGSNATAAAVVPIPETVGSQQTRWVEQFRLADGSNWAVTVNVMIQPFTITTP